MANVFLSSALLYLANEAAGCIDEEGNLIEDCDGKVYGFVPASLITNVAVISGLLTALFMPVVGAIIDYTPHRRLVGIATAVLITVMQGIQIGTVQKTWFAMAILQVRTETVGCSDVRCIIPAVSYSRSPLSLMYCPAYIVWTTNRRLWVSVRKASFGVYEQIIRFSFSLFS